MSQSNQPLVSVILPVYNTERYLPEAIESVLAQTYADFECVIVNNCCTDRSPEIIASYQRQDDRIRVVENDELLHQAANFNHALRQMSPSAKYCKMVLADDWIFPRCLEEMVALAEADPDVDLVSSLCYVDSNLDLHGLPIDQTVFDGRDIIRRLLLNGEYYFGSSNSVLYRADAVRSRDPFFKDDYLFEDADVCVDILKDSKFGFVHQALTFTRRENESMFTGILTYNHFLVMELLFLRRFGAELLSQDERARRWRNRRREYLLYLGEAVLRRREPEFWTFHDEMRELLEIDTGPLGLTPYTVLSGLELILNPKSTVERYLSYRRRQQS